MGDTILSMRSISKRFGAVEALVGVDLEVRKGTVHALIGENGAGKSTLMKVLSGSVIPDEGSMVLDGEVYAVRSPRDARDRGVSMIYQELTLAPHLSVLENITLGAERHTVGVIERQDDAATEALRILGHAHLSLSQQVRSLGVGEQQIVEIARSLFSRARLIIMDEPTSSLSREDTEALFAAIRRLRGTGVTVIYISHFLEEVKEISDTYTVLRDGRNVASGRTADAALAQLVTSMVGRTLDEMFPRIPHERGETVLEVNGLHRPPRIRDVSFTLHKGEILGIAGLVGAGRTETLRSLFGLDPADGGHLRCGTQAVKLRKGHTPRASLRMGVGMVSENRKEEGLAGSLSIRDNITLSSLDSHAGLAGILDLAKELSTALRQAETLGLKYGDILDPCGSLSGGNQQKVVLARMLAAGSEILLLDEPTRGIDVGSKVEIYALIGRLAAAHKAVVMVSSYLPELLGVCDTLAVMYRGTMSRVRPVHDWSEETVMALATTGEEP
jgi:ribose transport system ATP-binding protein